MTTKENRTIRDDFKALRRKRVVKALLRKLYRFSANMCKGISVLIQKRFYIATKENSPVRDGFKSPLPLTTIKTILVERLRNLHS